jgi:hypothetical protein
MFSIMPLVGVHLVTIGQILREYLVVATRPIRGNGLGLPSGQAVGNVATFRSRMHILPETSEVHDELATLVAYHSLRGKRIHDANVVAAVRYHRVKCIVTGNLADYSGLSDVPVLPPTTAIEEAEALV